MYKSRPFGKKRNDEEKSSRGAVQENGQHLSLAAAIFLWTFAVILNFCLIYFQLLDEYFSTRDALKPRSAQREVAREHCTHS